LKQNLAASFHESNPLSFLWAVIYYRADHFPRNYDALFWIFLIKLAKLQEIKTYQEAVSSTKYKVAVAVVNREPHPDSIQYSSLSPA
jgi:hypothetical protein